MRQVGGVWVVENSVEITERHVAHVRVRVIELGEQTVEVLLYRLSIRHSCLKPRTAGAKRLDRKEERKVGIR